MIQRSLSLLVVPVGFVLKWVLTILLGVVGILTALIFGFVAWIIWGDDMSKNPSLKLRSYLVYFSHYVYYWKVQDWWFLGNGHRSHGRYIWEELTIKN